MFSKACEYGIKATVYIAVRSLENSRISLKEIARETDSPEAFTAKILQQLSKNNIVQSLKGPTGGFYVSVSDMKKIHLEDIVRTIDGEGVFVACGLGMRACSSERPCPMHDRFKKVREELVNMLETTSIYDMVNKFREGIAYLKE